MTVGSLFLCLALIIFFALGVGVTLIPRAEAWGWFCVVLGLLLAPYPWPPWPRA